MVGFSFVQWCLLKCTYIDLLLMEPYWFPSPKSLDYQTNHGLKLTSEPKAPFEAGYNWNRTLDLEVMDSYVPFKCSRTR